MLELLRSNDPVLLSFAQHVLGELGIAVVLADQHISIMEGSIGAFPRRLLVSADDVGNARTALHEAGLGAELSDPS
jgi:hypothetical protein